MASRPFANSTEGFIARRAVAALAGLLLLSGWAAPAADPSPPEPLSTMEVTRVAGVDRYDGAVQVSRLAFPYGARTVYVTSGEKFADALSAGPAAIAGVGSLLLTAEAALPAVVAAEIARLAPDTIVVVGGEASVRPAVFETLRGLAPTVRRVTGADRYALSIAVARSAFRAAATVYIATGASFPDALSATPPAGKLGGPVVLVDGTASTLDPATRALLADLSTARVFIAGGTASVSAGIEAQLRTVVPTVTRLAGADRYAASVAVNRQAFTSSADVFLASGLVFSDALPGGVAAGTFGNPLFIVPPDCVPSAVLDALRDLGATDVFVLGGPATLSAGVARLTRCP